jgi:hypothetical protein
MSETQKREPPDKDMRNNISGTSPKCPGDCFCFVYQYQCRYEANSCFHVEQKHWNNSRILF